MFTRFQNFHKISKISVFIKFHKISFFFFFKVYNFKIFIKFWNSKFIVPETLTIDRGEAEVNSQGRGDNKLAIPEYTVYNILLYRKTFSWSFLCYFPNHS
jgi:hypothetical protein